MNVVVLALAVSYFVSACLAQAIRYKMPVEIFIMSKRFFRFQAF